MAEISSRDLLLLLLGTSTGTKPAAGIGGITRLQKLLFLLEREEQITPKGDAFHFTAYKAGPYSSRLYDDLEFLENLGLLRSEITSVATEAEAEEVDKLTFDELMEGGEGGAKDEVDERSMKAADAYEERRFTLTPDGKERVERLLQNGTFKPLIDGIRRIKSKFGGYSLSDLLFYVYDRYPDMTVESEIKEKVLRRKRKA